MNTLQPQNNPEELTTLARELSSPKDTEKLWQEVQNEWAEFFEQEARMTNAKDSIERRQILPYYLDELADVWWNIAKLRAFSDAGLTAEQQEIITQAEKKRTYGDTITARATKKYRERYGALKGLQSDEKNAAWDAIKRQQSLGLLRESERRGIEAVLLLGAGERKAKIGTLENLRGQNYQKVLVNKGLKDAIFRAISGLTGETYERIKAEFSRKDYCVLTIGEQVFLIQCIKGPEGVEASIALGSSNAPPLCIGGTDVLRKLDEAGVQISDPEVLPGTLFWGKGEILCLSDKVSVDAMLDGKNPNTFITRGTPTLTNMALSDAGITEARVVSTDSNVEGELAISAATTNRVTIGTEVVETGGSVVANENFILYWDEEKQCVIVYKPSQRGPDGKFQAENIYACIAREINPKVVEFVKNFQTPLDVAVTFLGEKSGNRCILNTAKRVMEVMGRNSNMK